IELDDEAPVEDDAPEIPFAEVYASADAAAGEKLWRACQACHKLDGSNGTGPYLNGVVDRDIGSISGYGYSEILASLDGNWTPEALSGFLANPSGYAEGTKMAYRGMDDVEDRANLIAYLAASGQ
ncbi:MAG: c-type cytochrome, partial [Pseudomonadota bacterium]